MKKKLLIAICAFTTMTVLAKDHVVIVKKSSSTNVKGKSEVTVDQTNESDSIKVNPGFGITDIQVTVKSLEGTIISKQVIPVDGNSVTEFTTPDIYNDSMIEVMDNTGIIYMDLESLVSTKNGRV